MIGHRFIVSRLLRLTILIAVLIEFSQRLTRNRQVAIVGSLPEKVRTEVEKIGSEDSGLWMRIHLNGFKFHAQHNGEMSNKANPLPV
jgi:hypothetical protein